MTYSWRRVDELPAQLRERWAAARVWAAHQAPYLATAVLALDPLVLEASDAAHADPDLSGFPADQDWHIYIDPEILAATPLPEMGFWLLHQVTHLLRKHGDRFPVPDNPAAGPSPIRRRTPEQQRWNLAGDAEINDDLCAGDVTLPAGATTPAQLGLPEGWTAEQYWDGLAHNQIAPNDCGSGCDGQSRPWDSSSPGLSDLEQQLLGQDVARRIREHVQRRGDVPAGWQRWADEILSPAIIWRRQLAAAVRRGVAEVAGRVDFTYRRPSRRAAAVPDVVLPSLRQPLPQVAMLLDTSGSMSDSMLAQALGEVNGVLRSLGLGRKNLRVLCCDAQAYAPQRIVDARDVQLLGGGGSDMGAGLVAAGKLRPRPDLIIVLTDGHTPWPGRPPDRMRVVVGLMDPAGNSPEWATTVLIPSGRPTC